MKKYLLIILMVVLLPGISYGGIFKFGGGFKTTQIDSLKTETGYLDGMSEQRQDLTVVVSGTSVYMDVEAIGGGNIEYWINGSKYTLDCTTGDGVGGKARTELTQGTAISPVLNYISVVYDTQTSTLTLQDTIAPPTGDFAIVAVVSIQDYSSVSTNGPMAYQRTTEVVSHNGKGAISWMREKLRAIGATYWSGVDQDLTITTNAGAEDDIDFTTTNGIVFQLHRQTWPDMDISTDGIYVVNVSGDGTLTNYQKITNLNSIHEIADGTALVDGDSINLVIWGAINYSGTDCKLFVSLPNGKYTTDANAVNDINSTAVTTIPAQLRTVGFLIAKLVLKYETADSGTWTNLLTKTTSTWTATSADVSSPNYPSNYGNNEDETTTLTQAGANAVRVHFDYFKTEANYDFVRILDASDNIKYTYHGNIGAFTSGEVSGTTLKVHFTSDGSVTRKGFHIDTLEYKTTSVSGAEVIDLRAIPVGFNIRAGG